MRARACTAATRTRGTTAAERAGRSTCTPSSVSTPPARPVPRRRSPSRPRRATRRRRPHPAARRRRAARPADNRYDGTDDAHQRHGIYEDGDQHRPHLAAVDRQRQRDGLRPLPWRVARRDLDVSNVDLRQSHLRDELHPRSRRRRRGREPLRAGGRHGLDHRMQRHSGPHRADRAECVGRHADEPRAGVDVGNGQRRRDRI